jgi:hypothetical protein
MMLSQYRQTLRWIAIEKIASNNTELTRLKEQYEITYYNITKRRMDQHFDAALIEKIKYFIMRLQFIHPIYLPSLSE